MTLCFNATLLRLLATAFFTVFALKPLPSLATTPKTQSQDNEASPHLKIWVYSSVKRLSPGTLAEAEEEANRLLSTTHVALDWVNCPRPSSQALCAAPEEPRDLILRVVLNAFPGVKANALGMTMWSPLGGSAVLFYDHVVPRRTQRIFAYQVLGRAIAHEIVHLLLPAASHADLGLMRAVWNIDDLEPEHLGRLALSKQSVELIRGEVLRRIRSSQSTSPAAILEEAKNRQLPTLTK